MAHVIAIPGNAVRVVLVTKADPTSTMLFEVRGPAARLQLLHMLCLLQC